MSWRNPWKAEKEAGKREEEKKLITQGLTGDIAYNWKNRTYNRYDGLYTTRLR